MLKDNQRQKLEAFWSIPSLTIEWKPEIFYFIRMIVKI